MDIIIKLTLAICMFLSSQEPKQEIIYRTDIPIEKPVVQEIKKYPAELTGYDNDYACTQSGKGITASGKKANRGTIAVPKNIPFGTEIELINAPDNVHPYRVAEDRGGAIKVKNGTYHFDVWFKTHKEALKFGRRKAVMYYKDNKIFIELED